VKENASRVIAPNQYRCAACNGVFEKTWTDEEAKAEHDARFAGCPISEAELVCDVCYNKILGIKPDGP
jgi:uncharacterized protein with PIN domain